MLRIRTLGATEITLGEQRLGTEQPMAFALVFLLATRGTIPSTRRELARLLWPEASNADQNHRLRSLLHRLRQMNISLVCAGATVLLGGDTLLDFRDYSTAPQSLDVVRDRVSCIGAVLPDLTVPSSALADRLDDERDIIVAGVSRWLNAALDLAKRAGDWPLVERVARAYRAIDALNEEAWLTLAETQCLTVGRECALGTLDEYRARVGEADLATPALLLRQRIEQRPAALDVDLDDLPFVGRQDVMRRLWSALAGARERRGTALVLWGPPGIGKTRILRELDRGAVLASARVIRAKAGPIHGLRPHEFTRDLVTRLLEQRGAAGCEPRAYALLHHLASGAPNDGTAVEMVPGPVALFDAFVELIGALADESPLVVVLDDTRWLEWSMWPFLHAVFRWSVDRRVLWVVAYRAICEGELGRLPDAALLHRVPVRSLDPISAAGLVDAALGSGRVSAFERDRILDSAGGHPLFLIDGARATRNGARAVSPPIDAILDDWLARLPNGAARTLQMLAALGGAATVETLSASALLTRGELTAGIGELERAGILRDDSGVLRAYSLWSNAALARLGATERRLLEEQALARDAIVIPFASPGRALVRERRCRYSIARGA
jgi:hypothetical protein